MKTGRIPYWADPLQAYSTLSYALLTVTWSTSEKFSHRSFHNKSPVDGSDKLLLLLLVLLQ